MAERLSDVKAQKQAKKCIFCVFRLFLSFCILHYKSHILTIFFPRWWRLSRMWRHSRIFGKYWWRSRFVWNWFCQKWWCWDCQTISYLQYSSFGLFPKTKSSHFRSRFDRWRGNFELVRIFFSFFTITLLFTRSDNQFQNYESCSFTKSFYWLNCFVKSDNQPIFYRIFVSKCNISR